MTEQKKILFIGLGNMGFGMALHFIDEGHWLYGFDLDPLVKGKFTAGGGLWLEDWSSISVDMVLSMLPGGKSVKQLYLGDQKLLSLLKPGTLVVDCSTADPQTVCELYEQAKKKSLRFLSAPVSGGTKGAREGTLTFMVGGDKRDFLKAKPFLEVMGKNIFYAGEAGDWSKCKNL